MAKIVSSVTQKVTNYESKNFAGLHAALKSVAAVDGGLVDISGYDVHVAELASTTPGKVDGTIIFVSGVSPDEVVDA